MVHVSPFLSLCMRMW